MCLVSCRYIYFSEPTFRQPTNQQASRAPHSVSFSKQLTKVSHRLLFYHLPLLLLIHTDSCVHYSILFYSRLCLSTTGSSNPPGSSNFLSFTILVQIAPRCLTTSFLQLRFFFLSFGLCVKPISYWTMPLVHGSLPNDDVTHFVFYLDI